MGWKIAFGIIGGILGTVIAAFLLAVLFLWICSLFVKNKEYEKHSRFYRWLLTTATTIGLWIVRVKIHTKGIEKMPQGRFLLVQNHRSKFDPLVSWVVFKKQDVAFISKKSNFKVPIFGKIIRKCCFMAIDRENPRNAVKTVEKASELLKNDEVSVGVYPEGTRSYGKELLPFHNSVFKIAQKAGVPIVITGIDGTEKVAKRTPWKRTDVYLEVLDVIPAEEAKGMRTAEIGERMQKKLNDWIKTERGENER